MIKLFKYFRSTWWEVLISLILVAGQAYAQLQLTDYMGKITQIVQTGGDVNEIWIQGGIMIGISVLVLTLAVGTGLLIGHATSVLAKNVRQSIYDKVSEFSLAEYDNFGTSTLLTRITNDVQTVKDTYTMSLRTMVMSPVTLIVAIIMVLTKDASLAIVLAISLPIIVITIIVLCVVSIPKFKKIQEAIDHVTVVMREQLTGVRVVRAFNQQEYERARFGQANDKVKNITIKVERIMTSANPIITVVFNMTYIAIFFYGFARLDGTFIQSDVSDTLSNMMVVAQYTMQIMMSFMMFAMILIMIPRGQVSAKRINAILETENTVLDKKDTSLALNNKQGKGVIEFKDVSFTFPDAQDPMLHHISFKTKPGEMTAIIGSTGSGKSTLINLIPRFYDVSEGAILFDGVDIRDYSQKDLRDMIGFVPQQALLFSGTIKDNMLFGNQNASDEDIKKALDVAQATHFVNKKEEGINARVSQGGKNFSGGQKQRLAIARALVKKPEVFIFDDSFSALDFKTDIKLRRALKDYVKDASIIVVAQRVSSILNADNIIVLDDGEIVGQGKHEQLLKSCPTYLDIVLSQLDPDEIDKTMKLGQQIMEGGEA